MNAFQIESWAIKVIERVETGQPDEDFKVELKSEWPEPQKAARRLAAHANASRGEPILWLIGVDQKARTVTGVSHMEVSTWYEQVRAEFDERTAPAMKDLNISYNGKTVVALLFDTERLPFVVKTAEGRLEVPWREGTLTRSAKRSELLKLLVPLQFLPQFEVLAGEVNIDKNNQGELSWRVHLNLYVEPRDDMRLVIPFHRCKASLEILDQNVLVELSELRLYPPSYFEKNFSKTIETTNDEVLVYGPGRVNFSAYASITELSTDLNHNLRVSAFVIPVGAEQPASFMATLTKSSIPSRDKSTLHTWKFEGASP